MTISTNTTIAMSELSTIYQTFLTVASQYEPADLVDINLLFENNPELVTIDTNTHSQIVYQGYEFNAYYNVFNAARTSWRIDQFSVIDSNAHTSLSVDVSWRNNDEAFASSTHGIETMKIKGFAYTYLNESGTTITVQQSFDAWQVGSTDEVFNFNLSITDSNGGSAEIGMDRIAYSDYLSLFQGSMSFEEVMTFMLSNQPMDSIQPWDGDDDATGGENADNFETGTGDDTADGGGGNDNLSGGTGDDDLAGGSGDDTIDGGEGKDNVDGGEGNDDLSGGIGNDKIIGGGGDDTLDGDSGKDTLSGGTGDDAYAVDIKTDKVIEAVGEGEDTVVASSDYTLSNNVEILQAAVTAAGTTTDGIKLTGSKDNNVIKGNDFNNVLIGGAGDDELFGYKGKDKIKGGSGADTFVYTSGDDSLSASMDIISDFSRKSGDKIDLSLLAGITFTDVVITAGVKRTEAIISIDTDGSGSADFGIDLFLVGIKSTDLSATDFIFAS